MSAYSTLIQSPLGSMVACSTDVGICCLEFVDETKIQAKLNSYQRLLHLTINQHPNSHLQQLANELEEYFRRKRTVFETPIDFVGTDFDKLVWNTLLSIPYGQTISYGKQSIQMGMPEAIRAIASANGRNRIAILVPCHRVIGANGKLTGYAAGLWRKQKLLELEGAANLTLF